MGGAFFGGLGRGLKHFGGRGKFQLSLSYIWCGTKITTIYVLQMMLILPFFSLFVHYHFFRTDYLLYVHMLPVYSIVPMPLAG